MSIVPGTRVAPANSTISCEASASARGGRCGSRPFSHRLEPSVRRPSRTDEDWIENPSKLAHSISTVVV